MTIPGRFKQVRHTELGTHDLSLLRTITLARCLCSSCVKFFPRWSCVLDSGFLMQRAPSSLNESAEMPRRCRLSYPCTHSLLPLVPRLLPFASVPLRILKDWQSWMKRYCGDMVWPKPKGCFQNDIFSPQRSVRSCHIWLPTYELVKDIHNKRE